MDSPDMLDSKKSEPARLTRRRSADLAESFDKGRVWQKGSATAPPNISRLHHSLSSTCDRRQLPNFRELASEVQ